MCGLSDYQNFLIISYKARLSEEKAMERKTRVLIFSEHFVWNISRKQNTAKYCHKLHKSSCKVPVVIVRF